MKASRDIEDTGVLGHLWEFALFEWPGRAEHYGSEVLEMCQEISFGAGVAVEPFHLDAYVDEQVFRYNNRKNHNDQTRFKKVLSQVAGKRLTYAEVTGKVGETAF